jgi:RNA polymerase-binding transcription factor DksA
MNLEKIKQYKKRLDEELKFVDGELRTLGVRDTRTGEWDATPGDIDESATEQDELADRIEQQEENADEIAALQKQLQNIKRALEKIDNGNYGVCEIGGEQIEDDRLGSNPSARTCKAHMSEEKNLAE